MSGPTFLSDEHTNVYMLIARRSTSHIRTMTTLTFGKAPDFSPKAQLVIGHKSLFSEQTVSATGLKGDEVSCYKQVASGKTELATAYLGEGACHKPCCKNLRV